MKTITLNLLTLLFCGSIFANAPAAEITSAIKSVTVFRSGAQVYRVGEGQVSAGQSILKFTGLSANLNPSSIQFTATGDFTILSVNFQKDYINPLENNEEVKTLQARIEELEEQLGRLAIDIQVLKEEEALLLANKEIGGQQNGVQLADLEAIAGYYRTRLKAIKVEQYDIGVNYKDIEREKDKLQKQLSGITTIRGRPRPPQASGEIWVKVTAERIVAATFQLSYMVSEAQWTPSYDIRVAEVGEDVVLDLKADVYQSSGEDWTGVELSLSTGLPTQSGVKPKLEPWWLAPIQPVAMNKKINSQAIDQSMEEMDARGIPPPPPPPPPPPMPANEPNWRPPAGYVNVAQLARATTREYQISLPYDVPSDGKPYTVAIETYEVPAEYQYYVAPKLNEEVFLTAKVIDWEEYKLLSGTANLFFEGSFLGRTRLSVNQTTDTLEISLGRDKGIVVKRTKDEQFKDRQFLGNKITQNIGWKIELRNTKNKAVSILVEDQYPVSTTDEIEIRLNNARGAKVDKEQGKLQWQVRLEPGESDSLSFQYEVKYPKRLEVQLE